MGAICCWIGPNWPTKHHRYSTIIFCHKVMILKTYSKNDFKTPSPPPNCNVLYLPNFCMGILHQGPVQKKYFNNTLFFRNRIFSGIHRSKICLPTSIIYFFEFKLLVSTTQQENNQVNLPKTLQQWCRRTTNSYPSCTETPHKKLCKWLPIL